MPSACWSCLSRHEPTGHDQPQAPPGHPQRRRAGLGGLQPLPLGADGVHPAKRRRQFGGPAALSLREQPGAVAAGQARPRRHRPGGGCLDHLCPYRALAGGGVDAGGPTSSQSGATQAGSTDPGRWQSDVALLWNRGAGPGGTGPNSSPGPGELLAAHDDSTAVSPPTAGGGFGCHCLFERRSNTQPAAGPYRWT